MKFHHAAITVNDLAESIAFYTEKLGFSLIQTFERPDLKGKAAFIKLGDFHVELWEFEDVQNNKDALDNIKIKGIRHLAFSVENIDVVVQELKAKGIEILEIKMGASGKRYAFFADPNGVALELYEA